MKSVFSMIFPKEMSTGIQSFFLASLATAETAVSTAAVPEAEAPQPMGLVNCHIAIENPPFFMGKSPFLMGKHHFFNGKTHYFDWAIFNSELLVYQRVYIYGQRTCGNPSYIWRSWFRIHESNPYFMSYIISVPFRNITRV